MASARKRSRADIEESRAECQFRIEDDIPREKPHKKQKKRRRGADGDDDDEGSKTHFQPSPFSPSGRFDSNETLDRHYVVKPYKKWMDMTRYNSFVLNGTKYFSEGFIYVANENTIARQKEAAEDPSSKKLQPRSKSDDDWVARILEIRASDEHHVYARIYWMYWPDELPPQTKDNKKFVQGRQPYHGHNELIASNHMDIINVVSVTMPATVKQWLEENDEEIQDALYWRQAFDVRSSELSSVERTCKCNQPANPDKTLIGCSNKSCSKWLHEECLQQDALARVYERLGRDKPHVKQAPEASEDGVGEVAEKKEAEDEGERPLSPTENGAEVQQTIDAKVDNVAEDILVKPEETDSTREQTDTTNQPSPSLDTPTTGSGRKGRPRKSIPGNKGKPWEGLFEATMKTDINPPMAEIRDLRTNVTGGEKSWLEPLNCLWCGTQIS